MSHFRRLNLLHRTLTTASRPASILTMPQAPKINRVSPLSADEAKWTELRKIEVFNTHIPLSLGSNIHTNLLITCSGPTRYATQPLKLLQTSPYSSDNRSPSIILTGRQATRLGSRRSQDPQVYRRRCRCHRADSQTPQQTREHDDHRAVPSSRRGLLR